MAQYEWRIPSGDTQVANCDYCEQPFPTDERLVLHKGLQHSTKLDETEWDSYEEARQEEQQTVRLIRLKALVALCLLYFSIPLTYALFG